MQPDWNRLRIFKEVFSRRSISRSAEVLHVTASAISQQLKTLEGELGFQLFVRNQRILVPTVDAKQLYELIDGFSYGLERSVATLSSKRNEISGTIRVGAPVAFGSGPLAMKALEFRRLQPGVRFEIRTATSPKRLVDDILNNHLDIAFIDTPPSKSRRASFLVTPVTSEKNVLVCTNTYFSSHFQGGTSIDHLVRCDFVSDSPDAPEVRCLFTGRRSKCSEVVTIPIVAGDIHGVVNLTLQGAGVAVLPRYIIIPHLESGKLVEVPGYSQTLLNQIVLLQLKERVPTPAEKHFVRFILQHRKQKSGAASKAGTLAS